MSLGLPFTQITIILRILQTCQYLASSSLSAWFAVSLASTSLETGFGKDEQWFPNGWNVSWLAAGKAKANLGLYPLLDISGVEQ